VAGDATSVTVTASKSGVENVTATDSDVSDGTYSVTLDELTEGTWSIISRQTNATGTSPKSPILLVEVDTTRPTLSSFTATDYTLGVGQTATVTMVFSEKLEKFGYDWIDYESEGEIGSFNGLAGDGGKLDQYEMDTHWFLFTATGFGVGTTAITAKEGDGNESIYDLAGNEFGSDDYDDIGEIVLAYSNIRPTVSLLAGDATLTAGQATDIIISFSHPVTGFTATEITKSGDGTLANNLKSGEDGDQTYTITYTAPASGYGTTIFSVAENVAADDYDNQNTAAINLEIGRASCRERV